MLFKKWWSEFTGLNSDVDLPEPLETNTRVILFLLAAFVGLLTPLIGLGVAMGWFEAYSLWIMLVLFATTGAAIGLTQWGNWKIARILPTLIFFSIGIYGIATISLASSYLLFFVLAILVAFLLFEPKTGWYVFGISVLAPLIVGALSGPPGASVIDLLPTSIVVVATYTSVAFLQRFATYQARAHVAKLSATSRALAETERYYQRLFQNAHDAIIVFEPQGEIVLDVNQRACELYGFARDEFIGMSLESISKDVPRGKELIKETLEEGGKRNFETSQYRKNGTEMILEVNASVVVFEGQTAILSLSREVTDRVKTEKALRESEERYRTLAEAAQDSIFIIDRQFRIAYVNSYGADQFDALPPDMIGRPVKDFFPPAVAERQINSLKGVFDRGEPIIAESQSSYRGREVWLSTRLVPLFNESGEVDAVLGLARDVTESVQAGRRLRLQGSALDAAANAILITDVKGAIEWVNPAFTVLTGYTSEEVLGKRSSILNSGKESQEFYKDLWDTILAGRVWQGEIINRRKDGELYYEEQTITPVLNDLGVITHFVSVKQDISGRKQSEAALQQGEEKYRNIFENAVIGIYQTSLEGQYLAANPTLARQLGYDSPEELLAAQTDLNKEFYVDPDGRAEFIRMMEEKGSLSDFEAQVYRKDGSVIWVSEQARTIYDSSGQLIGFEGTSVDISDRKQAEEALQESEARFRTLAESSVVGVYLIQDGRFRYVNPALAEGFGYRAEELVDKLGPLDLTHPDDVDRVVENIRRRVEGEVKSIRYEFRGLCKDGSIRQSEAFGTRIDYQGQPAVIGTLIDITERRRTEEALRESETRFRSLVENSSDEVSIVAADGSLLYESPSANPLLGYQLGQFLGKNLFRLVHPEDLDRVQSRFARLVQDENLHPREQFRLLHKDGTWRWVEALGTNLLAEPSVNGIVINYHDISDRKHAEEHIQQQFTRLAALHNIQTAISSSLDLKVTLQVLVEEITQQLKMDAVTIFLAGQSTGLKCVAARGFNHHSLVGESIRIGQPLIGQVALQRQVLSFSDIGKHLEHFPPKFNQMLESEGFRAYYGIPLIAKGEIKGALEIFHRQPHSEDQEWLDFLTTLGNQASIAIDNSGLFNELHRSNVDLMRAYDSTLEGWSRALELRDHETEGHTQRVTDLCLRLAEAMGLKGEELTHIRRGALIHDIGKMGVTDEILNKPGPLTEEEWAAMRMHPTYAYEMLAPIQFLRPALDIPHYHHEKWDGSGYPTGMKGEQIPIAARIFAVVDVWDALCSDRPYRNAWSKGKTLDYIRENAGSHFDPRVVEKFLELVD